MSDNKGDQSRSASPVENPFASKTGPNDGFAPTPSQKVRARATLPTSSSAVENENPFAKSGNRNTGGFAAPFARHAAPRVPASSVSASKDTTHLGSRVQDVLRNLRRPGNLEEGATQPNGAVRIKRTWFAGMVGPEHMQETAGGNVVLAFNSGFRSKGPTQCLPDEILEWMVDEDGASELFVPAAVSRAF